MTIYAQGKTLPHLPMKCHSQRKTRYESAVTQTLRVGKHFKKEEINTVVPRTAEGRGGLTAKETQLDWQAGSR